jgi:hypothetical protein
VAAENGRSPLGELVDVAVNFLGCAEGKRRKGSEGDFGFKKVGEFVAVGPAEIAALARRTMFERDGKDARNERVVRAMTRKSLALLQKRPEGHL